MCSIVLYSTVYCSKLQFIPASMTYCTQLKQLAKLWEEPVAMKNYTALYCTCDTVHITFLPVTIYTVPVTLYTVHYTCDTVHYTVHTTITLYTGHCICDTIQTTLYTVHFELYPNTIQTKCTLYPVL